MREFFGFVENTRPVHGFFSWQHITFVTTLMVIMALSAFVLSRRNRHASGQVKNRVLICSALLIDGFEIAKILIACIQDPSAWSRNLPLFLCSIQLITIPLAAFAQGRLKEAAMDFVAIFGILGAVLGTYGAAQNYNCYPVLSWPNVVSGITHSISGFASLYIMCSGLLSLRRKNMSMTFGILFFFCAAALLANWQLDYNYMFLRAGDGTPYDVLFNLVGGHKIFYPAGVIGLFLLYIGAFYAVHSLAERKKAVVA